MNIGYFFDNKEKATEYAKDIFELLSKYDKNIKFKEKSLTIEAFSNKLMFIILEKEEDVLRIQGMDFDGVFLKSIFTQKIDRCIMSRFRPTCSCKENK